MSYSDLKDKVAIITGGGSGIGEASAFACKSEGVLVAVVDKDEVAGRSVVERINASTTSELTITNDQKSGRAIFVSGDVTLSADVMRIVSQITLAFGRIDILHNNAGIAGSGTVVTTDEALWDKVISVNLKSVYLVSKYVIPHLIQAGGGAIINTASVQAQLASANSAAYVASKGAILALTREMAVDFASANIRVNAVLPGSIDTPTLRRVAQEQANPERAMAEWGAGHLIGRLGTPQEVAKVVVFLASSAASFITGAPFLVDGGIGAKLF